MENILVTPELSLLWRLSGRKEPGQQAAALEAKFQLFRPRILEMMREMVIIELEQDFPLIALTRQEIAVLLGSADGRVRQFGIRLLPYSKG
jgi:hypothetical protein